MRNHDGDITRGTSSWFGDNGADHGGAAPQGPAKKQGQLWEECPNCGSEPVYMPLGVCENCWPR